MNCFFYLSISPSFYFYLFCLPISLAICPSLISHVEERNSCGARGAAPDLSQSQVRGCDMAMGLSPWQPHRCWGGGWQNALHTIASSADFVVRAYARVLAGIWYIFFFCCCLDFFFFFNRKALFVFFRGGSNQACGNTSTAICSAQFIQTGALDIKDKQKLSCYSRPHMCTLHFKYIGLCGVRGGGKQPTK